MKTSNQILVMAVVFCVGLVGGAMGERTFNPPKVSSDAELIKRQAKEGIICESIGHQWSSGKSKEDYSKESLQNWRYCTVCKKAQQVVQDYRWEDR